MGEKKLTNELDYDYLVHGRVGVSDAGGDLRAGLVQEPGGVGQSALFPDGLVGFVRLYLRAGRHGSRGRSAARARSRCCSMSWWGRISTSARLPVYGTSRFLENPSRSLRVRSRTLSLHGIHDLAEMVEVRYSILRGDPKRVAVLIPAGQSS
jgi:hypothetical protein